MAGPTYGTAGTRLTSATATTAQIAVPSGVVSGSVIVIALYRSGSIYQPITTIPTGFLLVSDNPGLAVGATQNHSVDVLWKRATGADTGTYDFTIPNATRVGFALRLDGCRGTGNPFEADDGAVTSGTDTTTTPAVTVTTTGPNRLLVWVGSSWTTGTWTQPSGFTARVTDVDFDLLTASTAAQAAAGSSGTVQGSQTSQSHAAWVGAFAADEPLPPKPIVGASLAAMQAASW